jgi:hypothetical protein
MLTIKNRVITTVALLAVAAPAFLLTPSAEAAVSNRIVKQSVSGNLIADRHHDDNYNYDYEYNERHDRHRNRARHRRHHNNNNNYQYNSSYRTPAIIYKTPIGIFAPSPQVIYAPAPQHRGCVRTLYSTICN